MKEDETRLPIRFLKRLYDGEIERRATLIHWRCGDSSAADWAAAIRRPHGWCCEIPPDNTSLESMPVLIKSLDGNRRYEPASSPPSDEVWRQLSDRLNLRIVIYPSEEPGRKADIRVIGEFNPSALVELPADSYGSAATVNTLSWRRGNCCGLKFSIRAAVGTDGITLVGVTAGGGT